MKATKRKFIMDELMIEDFLEWSANEIHLEETDEAGESKLDFQVISKENLMIRNVDKKKTLLPFFQDNSEKSMNKRVDHMIFEHLSDENWKLHLIEMKSSLFDKKWREVKGKFRASYLLAQGIAAMLEMKITDICMYTTYETVHFQCSETMPSERRLLLGVPQIRPQEEWASGKVGLNFGTRIIFSHTPIQMDRDEDNVLVGEYICRG